MKFALNLLAVTCGFVAMLAPAHASDLAAASAPSPKVVAAYGRLPLSFTANQGQADPRFGFTAQGSGYSIFFARDKAELTLVGAGLHRGRRDGSKRAPATESTPEAILHMSLLGAAEGGKNASGLEALPGTSNYLMGNDPSKWHTDVPSFGKVEYGKVYPGVDLLYYGNQKQLEFDFVVQPGADTSAIGFKVDGTARGKDVKLRINEVGDLTADGEGILLHKPVLYQSDAAHGRHLVDGSFVLAGANEVRFRIGEYDRSRELVIDPTLAYSTYFGGAGDTEPYGFGIDALGNSYILGYCSYDDVPITPGAYQTTTKYPDYGLFVAKLNQDGSALVYSTYLTDPQDTAQPRALAVSAAGNAYILGQTYSSAFPTTAGAYQRQFTGDSVRFVTELNTTGRGLVYSTFLGGGDDPGLNDAIAVDEQGSAYVAGTTLPTGVPVTPGVFKTGPINNSQDVAFVTKLNPQGSGLVYSALVAGGGVIFNSMAIDAAHNVYLTGETENYVDLPLSAGAYQTTSSQPSNYFVTKINPTATKVMYSTLFPAARINAMAVDSAGAVYLAGQKLYYLSFPTTPGAFETACGTYCDPIFVTKLNPSGTALVYSTLVGGGNQGISEPEAISVNAAGEAYIFGETSDPQFPVTADAFQKVTTDPFENFSTDDFFTKVNATGSGLIYSTRIGGNGADYSVGLELDSAGNVYLLGRSVPVQFEDVPKYYPATPGAYQTTWPNSYQPPPEGEFNELFTATLSKFSFGAQLCSFAPVVEAVVNRNIQDSFVLTANFSPGSGSTIDPVNEPIAITIGPYSVTIPKNSFTKNGTGYTYQGTINGLAITTSITQAGPYTIPRAGSMIAPAAAASGCSTQSYILAASGRGAVLQGLTNPVSVTLAIGDDSSTQKVQALIEQ